MRVIGGRPNIVNGGNKGPEEDTGSEQVVDGDQRIVCLPKWELNKYEQPSNDPPLSNNPLPECPLSKRRPSTREPTGSVTNEAPFLLLLLLPVRHFQSATSNRDSSVESGPEDAAYDSESLPSYTLVSGLPSYDDALDCYRKTQGSASARPSLMKLFSFDNPLLVGVPQKDPPAEPLQVVVEEDKRGLPSYQESVATIVDEKRRPPSAKKTVYKPVLPLKGGLDPLPQVHKSPSMVLVYDDEYWRNVHKGQHQEPMESSPSASGSSSSLPRNFSTSDLRKE